MLSAPPLPSDKDDAASCRVPAARKRPEDGLPRLRQVRPQRRSIFLDQCTVMPRGGQQQNDAGDLRVVAPFEGDASLQRLHVDPMSIYGTDCLKLAGEDEAEALPYLLRELHLMP